VPQHYWQEIRKCIWHIKIVLHQSTNKAGTCKLPGRPHPTKVKLENSRQTGSVCCMCYSFIQHNIHYEGCPLTNNEQDTSLHFLDCNPATADRVRKFIGIHFLGPNELMQEY